MFNFSVEKLCPNYKTVSLIKGVFGHTLISPLDTNVNNQILKLKHCVNSVNL